MRRLRSVGLVLVVLGAAVLVSPSLGFQTLEADRSVTAETAPDPDALLGVVDNSAAAEADVTADSTGIPFYLDDNHGDFDAGDIIASAVSFGGSSTALQANVTADPGAHDFRIDVSCGNSALDADGVLTVGIGAADGVTVDLERTTDQQISVDCRSGSGSGFAGQSASDMWFVQETTQTFTFEPSSPLQSGAQVVIDLSDPQSDAVDYSGATVASATGGTATLYEDTATLVYTPETVSDNEVTIQVDGVQVGTGYSNNVVSFVRTDTHVEATTTFSTFRFNWGASASGNGPTATPSISGGNATASQGGSG